MSVDCLSNLSGVSLHHQQVEVGLLKKHQTILKAGLKDVGGRDLVGGKGAY